MSEAGTNATASNPSDTLTACPVCREPIQKGARKCIHCSSMIDWRGWLGISETALALLVALVTVLGATTPRIVELFTHKYADVRLNYYQVSGGLLELTAWNQGNRNGLLLSAKIIAKGHDGKELAEINLDNTTPSPIVAGQTVSSSAFRVPPAQVIEFLEWPHKDIQSVSLIANVAEFGKAPGTRPVDIPLVEFRRFCRATEEWDTQARHPYQPQEQRKLTKCL